MHAIKEVAEAKGGIAFLAAWTQLSYQNLAYLLRVKHPSQLDKRLDILSGVKDYFRTHPAEEMRSVAHEKSGDSEEHDENQPC